MLYKTIKILKGLAIRQKKTTLDLPLLARGTNASVLTVDSKFATQASGSDSGSV